MPTSHRTRLGLAAASLFAAWLPSAAGAGVFLAISSPPSVVEFAPGASGTAAPVRTLAGPATLLVAPDRVSFDPAHGEMLVADFFGPAIRAFAATANGNTAPLRSLVDGPLSGLRQPRAAVVDAAHDELIVASFADSIRVYPRLANGDVAPLRVIAGPSTGLDNPAVLLDAAHDELVVGVAFRSTAGSNLGRVLVFPRAGSGDIAPVRSFTSSAVATLGNSLSLDAARGELYVDCLGGNGICVFPRTASGDVAPLRVIAGPSTRIFNVDGVAFDAKNDRVVVLTGLEGGGDAAVLSFPRTATGDVAPLVAVTGPALGSEQNFVGIDTGGGLTGGTPDGSHSGLVYTLQSAPAGNRIFGFVANEATGALTALPGFPVPTGGRGDGLFHVRFLTLNALTARLFAYNDLDGTLSAFSVNRATGALQRLPYSPFPAGSTAGNCLEVSPAGSPLLLTDSSVSFTGVRGFDIGPATVAASPGSPLPLQAGSLNACGFDPRGEVFYAGGGVASDTFLTALRLDYPGTLVPLDGVPFNAGGPSPTAFAVSGSRILVAHQTTGTVRAFLRQQDGTPDTFDGVSHPSGISNASVGVATPFGYYYVADPTGNRIGAYRVALAGGNTSWSTVPGSPLAAGSGSPGLLAASDAGSLLVLGRTVGRSLSTYRADPASGALTPLANQPANSAGSTGQLNGLVYFGGTAPATPANFRVVTATRSSVSLRWLDRADNESSFVLEMRRGNQPFAVVKTLGPNVGVTQLSKLSPGAAYTFRLRARNVLGDSATVLTARTLPK